MSTPPKRAKTGGRVARVTAESVLAAGRQVGLAALSVQAVAEVLGVSATAVYRHVPSRAALERLVGESVVAELDLVTGPDESAAGHLLRFAARLREFALANPGVGGYLQRVFPRGPSGSRLLAHEVAVLGGWGYRPDAAIALSGAVGTVALGLTATEECRFASGPEERAESAAAMADHPDLLAGRAMLPAVPPETYFALLMAAVVDGLLRRLPPGRPVTDLLV
ncbi:TetR family transcriptional regulator [Actinosynnema sp. NPDC047251]|uniref:Uncharacterized protein n=1 Tax=Saccharothrix espanaensis (strain ATCC 51144 / DSM 44229 / JCM 9112 / NBRC 15066 / NRRL 15764) TaxID=1179773 RepID=K0K361_SACES|nr:TetR family transcriptional regulator [Saccharothrix espanaensis]CCH30993.1 hypothetical protein BN6_37000 [Saccharothrix espanaensis DSM 44229]